MTNRQEKQKLKTSAQCKSAIMAIIEKRSLEASQSQYDKSVCIRAVAATRDVIESIPTDGTAIEYGQATIELLSNLYETYHDTDGEYTSGKAPIGNIYSGVLHILSDLTSDTNS